MPAPSPHQSPPCFIPTNPANPTTAVPLGRMTGARASTVIGPVPWPLLMPGHVVPPPISLFPPNSCIMDGPRRVARCSLSLSLAPRFCASRRSVPVLVLVRLRTSTAASRTRALIPRVGTAAAHGCCASLLDHASPDLLFPSRSLTFLSLAPRLALHARSCCVLVAIWPSLDSLTRAVIVASITHTHTSPRPNDSIEKTPCQRRSQPVPHHLCVVQGDRPHPRAVKMTNERLENPQQLITGMQTTGPAYEHTGGVQY